jgi:hypothetical protein
MPFDSPWVHPRFLMMSVLLIFLVFCVGLCFCNLFVFVLGLVDCLLLIKALVDHFMKLVESTGSNIIEMTDIRWVLTVPAIWSDGAKQFMRKSAEMVQTTY